MIVNRLKLMAGACVVSLFGLSANAGEPVIPSIVSTPVGIDLTISEGTNIDFYIVKMRDSDTKTDTWFSIGPPGVQQFNNPDTGLNSVTTEDQYNEIKDLVKSKLGYYSNPVRGFPTG